MIATFRQKNTIGEVIVEILMLLVVVGSIVYFFFSYSKLPETVPNHIDLKGQIDGYGKKTSNLILPILQLVFYIGLSVLQKFPNIYNYPIEVTEKNMDSLYALGVKAVSRMKFFVVLIFANMMFSVTELAFGRNYDAIPAISMLLVVSMMIMLVYYIVKMSKQQQ